MAEILVSDLTESTTNGSGVFDVIMQATKAHLNEEYKSNRIKGPEYATVYLGALQSAMNQALQFVLTKQRSDYEARLMEAQIITEGHQQALLQQQLNLMTSERDKVIAEIAVVNQQASKLVSEKAGIDSQTNLTEQQRTNLVSEKARIDAETSRVTQQTTNLAADKLLTDAKVSLTTQQATNAITENLVLVAQECKLKAEFDQLKELVLKTTAETTLLNQKRVTEAAQTSGTGVDADSVIGRQKGLYTAQADGFIRDAEQKAAKLMLDTWNVRRTTDVDATLADTTNKLNDASIGRVVDKLLAGVNA